MNDGILMVLSGPSGSGKGTVAKKLTETASNIFLSVSATTREPRAGEENGKQYYFLKKDKFLQMIKDGEFIEHAEYDGNYYGTPAAPVRRILAEGKNVLLEIDIQGGLQVRRIIPDTVLVFLVPPSRTELEKRLRGRRTESDELIERRLKLAMTEYEQASEYDYIVVNDTVEEAVLKLRSIIAAERCKSTKIRFVGDDKLVV